MFLKPKDEIFPIKDYFHGDNYSSTVTPPRKVLKKKVSDVSEDPEADGGHAQRSGRQHYMQIAPKPMGPMVHPPNKDTMMSENDLLDDGELSCEALPAASQSTCQSLYDVTCCSEE